MKPYIINITGKPDSGKTTLALYLLEYFKVVSKDEIPTATHIAIEPMAALRKGIPYTWTDGRIQTIQPGVVEGKRKTGKQYYDAVMASTKEPTGTPLNIVDTMSGLAFNRQADTVTSQGGLPSDSYKEYGAAQTMVRNYLTAFNEVNSNSMNIFLHHSKVIDTYPERKVVDNLPDLVGQKLDDIWPGQFHACFWIVRETVRERNEESGKMEDVEKFLLHLTRPKLASFVRIQKALGSPNPTSPLDITVKGSDWSLLRTAWDVILSTLD